MSAIQPEAEVEIGDAITSLLRQIGSDPANTAARSKLGFALHAIAAGRAAREWQSQRPAARNKTLKAVADAATKLRAAHAALDAQARADLYRASWQHSDLSRLLEEHDFPPWRAMDLLFEELANLALGARSETQDGAPRDAKAHEVVALLVRLVEDHGSGWAPSAKGGGKFDVFVTDVYEAAGERDRNLIGIIRSVLGSRRKQAGR